MTIRRPRAHASRWFALPLIVCVGASALLARPAPLLAQSSHARDAIVGSRLEDALRALQARGVRLVFSSELVTPDMRVRAEPRARDTRTRLAELLRPHGLAAEPGPGGILQVVRQKAPAVERPSPATPSATPPRKTEAEVIDVGAGEAFYRERVTVFGDADESDDGVDARRLASGELRELSGHIADDPLRVVQSLPGVAAGDDFRGEFSVRGSRYRHAGVIIDGVVAPWLQHAALGRGDTGTMTMLRGDLIQQATLSVGAYPRRDSSQIGPQLNLTLREGSRAAPRFTLGVGGVSATATAEGPIHAGRGSWLVGIRKSHSEWPVGSDDYNKTVFGYGDVQAKVVYDVRPGQQLSLSLVGGVSNVEREDPGPVGLADGLNRAAMVNVAWRAAVGARTVVTQRVSSIAHDFLNDQQLVGPGSGGTNGAHAYRVDVARPFAGGVVDVGGQVRRVRGSRHASSVPAEVPEDLIAPLAMPDVDSSWLERSTHASFRRPVGRAVLLAAGLRWTDSTLVDRSAIDRWLQAEWSVAPRWIVHASTGVTYQFAAIEQIAGWPDAASVRPERAASVDAGIGHHLSSSLRWDVTAFLRRERDALREPDVYVRSMTGLGTSDVDSARYENALSGSARGVELSLTRRSATGVSGWLGYSYGIARYTDPVRRETFAADFDQRHAINVSGLAPLPWRARLGVTFRGGTNFPIPGYLVSRDAGLFVGSERNRARLPAYARLDLRAERAFERRSRRFVFFAEAVNVLNRANVGPGDGVIRRDTGAAVGFTERLFPRLLTAGLRVEF